MYARIREFENLDTNHEDVRKITLSHEGLTYVSVEYDVNNANYSTGTLRVSVQVEDQVLDTADLYWWELLAATRAEQRLLDSLA